MNLFAAGGIVPRLDDRPLIGDEGIDCVIPLTADIAANIAAVNAKLAAWPDILGLEES